MKTCANEQNAKLVLAFTASVAKFQVHLVRLKPRARQQQRQLVARSTPLPTERGAVYTKIFHIRSKLPMNYYAHSQSDIR